MEAKDLRIGNILSLYEEGCGFNDVEISLDDLKIIDQKELNLSYYFEPILLTEDWLIKSGAFHSKEMLVYPEYRLEYKERDKKWEVLDLKTNCYITMIEFVHEWQNFIFIVKGYELTFKS